MTDHPSTPDGFPLEPPFDGPHTLDGFDDVADFEELSPAEEAALAAWLQDPAVWAEPSPEVEDRVVAAITAAAASARWMGGDEAAPDRPSSGPAEAGPAPSSVASIPGGSALDGSAPEGSAPAGSAPGGSSLGGPAPDDSTADAAAPVDPEVDGGGTWAEPIPINRPRRRMSPGVDRRRRRFPVRGLAAAAVALVAVVGAVTVANRLGQEPGVRVELAGGVVAPDASAVARIEDLPNGARILLDVSGLPPAPEGSFYAAWVVKPEPKVRIPIGSFHMRGGDGTVELWSGVPLADYPIVSVTLQSETDPAGPGEPALKGQLPG